MKRLPILLLFIACNSQAAGIQKWVDENGQVHYGDSPPAQIKAESVNVTRPPSNPGKPLPRFSGSDAEAKPEAQHPDQKPPAETSEEQAVQACEQAQKDLAVMNRSTRIRLKQADGTTRYMTAEEIEERRKQTEADIEQFCK